MLETVAGWIIWTVLGLGYLSMLALTERSAARYVASDTHKEHAPGIVIANAGPAPAQQPTGARWVPVSPRANDTLTS